MSASDNLQPQQFFHATHKDLEPGAKLRGGMVRGGLPRGEAWRDNRVWMADSPTLARQWTTGGSGHVYEVQPNRPRLHTNLTDYDYTAEVSDEALDRQYHAPSAMVIRRLGESDF